MRRPWVSFKFPRCRKDQRLANFNGLLHIETRSCYSCLVLCLHDSTESLVDLYQILRIIILSMLFIILFVVIFIIFVLKILLRHKCFPMNFAKF